MSIINDQTSDTGSELNWSYEQSLGQDQHDKVVFENVADQYVKGQDVTTFFTILQEIKVNSDEDQIGLLRVGCMNIDGCLAYASVQFNPSTTSGSIRHGTATFPASSLPATDDEFYQFCYILNKTKNLGSSIPFQLNCAPDDIDLLTNVPIRKTKPDGLIALADYENDDMLVIHPKHMLTEEKLRKENRQLLEMNRQLEMQKDECQGKIDLLEAKTNDHLRKAYNDMEALTTSHKVAIDELSSRQKIEAELRTEYDTCRSLCDRYQAESAQHAERCRTLENTNVRITTDMNQVRSQLATASQFAKDQATQIIALEHRLMQSNEVSKESSQRQLLLEQQIHDLRLTSEKNQIGIETQCTEKEKQIHSLNEEINSLKHDNQHLSSTLKQEKERLEELQQQYNLENEKTQNKIELLEKELDEIKSNQDAYAALRTSYGAIEKRCIKHQKSEVEAKRQIAAYQKFINDLQRENQELAERLSAGAESYKTLFRKCAQLEKSILNNKHQENQTTTNLTNEPVFDCKQFDSFIDTLDEPVIDNNELNSIPHDTDEIQQAPVTTTTTTNVSNNHDDDEVSTCPLCYLEFHSGMTIQQKTEHIEHHFA